MLDKPEYDVVVVGAGFAGLYALHRLRGLGFRTLVVETGDGIGGTWYWNAYPGARCDVESMEYSYSFSPELDQEWQWSERYAAQPEILRYIEHVADRFNLRRDIRLSTRITRADYDEHSAVWSLSTDDSRELSSRFVIFATGSLSAPLAPTFPGVDTFAGQSYMTQTWPRDTVDLTGKRVALIGTGSSGVQVLPEIAQQAAHVTVFQRTPNFSAPGHNRSLSVEDLARMKAEYPDHRAAQRNSHGGVVLDINRRRGVEMTPQEQGAELEKRWNEGGVLRFTVAFRDVLTSIETNSVVQDFIRRKIRERVTDPMVAELLCPDDHMFGSKRPCVDHGYFEAYNRDNVTLVNVRDNPIEAITPTGPQLQDGSRYDVDVIIYANGYDAISGALSRIDIRGRGGLSLRGQWTRGPRTYLGLAMAGFPNLFSLAGPGSPAVLAMMIGLAEQHVDWVANCLADLRTRGLDEIEASQEAQESWTHRVQAMADSIPAYRLAERSYFVGANVPGKPRAFPIYVGGMQRYRAICDEVAQDGYQGFVVDRVVGEVVAQ